MLDEQMKAAGWIEHDGKISGVCGECGKAVSVSVTRFNAGRGRYCSLTCTSKAGKRARWGVGNGTAASNLDRHVQQNDGGCWGWTGTVNRKGYGNFKLGHRHVSAHRASYERHKGPIPEGLLVLHRCDNPPCTNPDHLFLGTGLDNAKDRDRKGRGALGQASGKTTMTDDQVRAIRERHANGETISSVARAFGLTHTGAAGIIKRRTWKHVD